MRRRNVIAGLVSTTATWSLAAHAQQSATPVIGFLGPGLAEFRRRSCEGFSARPK